MTECSGIVADVLADRPIPAPNPDCDFFWNSGRDSVLRILRCAQCGYYVHPPSTPCPACLSTQLRPAPVSGAATVHTFTVNIQQWVPGQQPYVIALVELAEQEGLRLTTNIVGCALEDVSIGMPVQVRFVRRDAVFYPVFTPTQPKRGPQ